MRTSNSLDFKVSQVRARAMASSSSWTMRLPRSPFLFSDTCFSLSVLAHPEGYPVALDVIETLLCMGMSERCLCFEVHSLRAPCPPLRVQQVPASAITHWEAKAMPLSI